MAHVVSQDPTVLDWGKAVTVAHAVSQDPTAEGEAAEQQGREGKQHVSAPNCPHTDSPGFQLHNLNPEETVGCSSHGDHTNKEQLWATRTTALPEPTTASIGGLATLSVWKRASAFMHHGGPEVP